MNHPLATVNRPTARRTARSLGVHRTLASAFGWLATAMRLAATLPGTDSGALAGRDTREAVVWMASGRTTRHATYFLEQVVATLPCPVEAVLTDNDLIFTMRFAHVRTRRTRFEQAGTARGIRHRLLRPHAPESNGKVERFIKTIEDECLAVHHRRPAMPGRASSRISSGTTTITDPI